MLGFARAGECSAGAEESPLAHECEQGAGDVSKPGCMSIAAVVYTAVFSNLDSLRVPTCVHAVVVRPLREQRQSQMVVRMCASG